MKMLSNRFGIRIILGPLLLRSIYFKKCLEKVFLMQESKKQPRLRLHFNMTVTQLFSTRNLSQSSNIQYTTEYWLV